MMLIVLLEYIGIFLIFNLTGKDSPKDSQYTNSTCYASIMFDA